MLEYNSGENLSPIPENNTVYNFMAFGCGSIHVLLTQPVPTHQVSDYPQVQEEKAQSQNTSKSF